MQNRWISKTAFQDWGTGWNQQFLSTRGTPGLFQPNIHSLQPVASPRIEKNVLLCEEDTGLQVTLAICVTELSL